jgi:hypothetical protein
LSCAAEGIDNLRLTSAKLVERELNISPEIIRVDRRYDFGLSLDHAIEPDGYAQLDLMPQSTSLSLEAFLAVSGVFGYPSFLLSRTTASSRSARSTAATSGGRI